MYIEKAENKIKRLMNSSMSAYAIAQKTGVSQSLVTKYRNENSKIENMTLAVAKKFEKLYDEEFGDMEEIKTYTAEEVFNEIKNATENVSFSVIDETGAVLVNYVTENWQDVFCFVNTEYGTFYGAYGDAVINFAQVDSRKYSDEDIIESIKELSTYGKFVKTRQGEQSLYRTRKYFYKDGTGGMFMDMNR